MDKNLIYRIKDDINNAYYHLIQIENALAEYNDVDIVDAFPNLDFDVLYKALDMLESCS